MRYQRGLGRKHGEVVFVLVNHQELSPNLTQPENLSKNLNQLGETQFNRDSTYSESRIQYDQHPNPKALHQQALNSYQSPKKYYRPKPVFYARDIMTKKVHTVSDDTLLASVLTDFLQKGFSHIPIVDKDGLLVGLISGRSIHQWSRNIWTENPLAGTKEFTTASSMRSEVLCAQKDTTIRMIANVMLEKQMGCVPIVNESHQLIGLVTQSDILKALVKHESLETWL